MTGKNEIATLEEIKKLALISMFSDDLLMEHLVLKGGNAMDLVLQVSGRSSIDLDFSIDSDFPGGLTALTTRTENTLRGTFREAGYEPFDISVQFQPPKISTELIDFWGGYSIEFKLIDRDKYRVLVDDLDALRRQAIHIGRGAKFLIDISCHEFTGDRQKIEFDGYKISIYSPTMMVAEKLRAICQQSKEYGEIVKRTRPGGPRARDFVDIYVLVEKYGIDVTSTEFGDILSSVFSAKRVPLSFLDLIEQYKDFHSGNFQAVKDTVKPDFELQDFDFYFRYVLELVAKIPH